MLARATLPTPLGPLVLVWDAAGRLWLSELTTDPDRPATSMARFRMAAPAECDPPPAFADAFAAWFAGDLAALDHLPLAPLGTPFQQAVWAELRRIPPGETRSYGDVARALGGAASGQGVPIARAVGTANGRNPRAIVVPCHRVVQSNGGLGGYAGGLAAKAWLLAHEGALASELPLA